MKFHQYSHFSRDQRGVMRHKACKWCLHAKFRDVVNIPIKHQLCIQWVNYNSHQPPWMVDPALNKPPPSLSLTKQIAGDIWWYLVIPSIHGGSLPSWISYLRNAPGRALHRFRLRFQRSRLWVGSALLWVRPVRRDHVYDGCSWC